jgi:hypothetical protein
VVAGGMIGWDPAVWIEVSAVDSEGVTPKTAGNLGNLWFDSRGLLAISGRPGRPKRPGLDGGYAAARKGNVAGSAVAARRRDGE